MEPPPSTASPPLLLDEYVTIIIKRREGVIPDDETVHDLLREVGIERNEEEWIERGAPEVLYSGFMWEPDKVTDELSDACLATLGLAGVLKARHQLLYWQPMIEMGKEGRFRGHLSSMEETRDILRAVARRLIDRPDLMRKLPRLQPHLAETIGQVLRALPGVFDEDRDREILIPVVLSEEDIPTGDDEDDYDRKVTQEEEEERIETQEIESATASTQEATDRSAAGPPHAPQRGGKGLFIAVIVILGILTVAVLLALKYLI